MDTALGQTESQGDDYQGKILDGVVQFLSSFDAHQMRYVGPTFLTLVDLVASGSLLPVSSSPAFSNGMRF